MVQKIVDVFLRDRLVASYSVVVTLDRPIGDEDFVEQVKERMSGGSFSPDDVASARFMVRPLGGA